MKVLITGATSTLVGRPTRMDIQAFSFPLVRCMREAGIEVDQRPVVPGEDLSKYDVTLVGMAPMYSVGARWVFGALHALSLIAGGKIAGAVLCNDWDFRTPFKEFRFTRDRHWHDDNFPAKVLLPRFNRSEFFDNISGFWDLIEHAAGLNSWPALLSPAFHWPGVKHDLCLLETQASFAVKCFIDPTPWVEPYCADPVEREPTWVSASLHPADEWRTGLGLGWPVRELGTLSLGQERVSERAVVELYQRSWGLLSHPYYHSGSGFWRNRFNYGVANGCIVLASPYEVEADSARPGHVFCPEPWAIEQMSDSELATYAYAQWAWFDKHTWTHDRMATEVGRFLSDVSGGHLGRLSESGRKQADNVAVSLSEIHPFGTLDTPSLQPQLSV